MQPSTTPACNDSLKSMSWNFSNYQTPSSNYGNVLGSESNVQETSRNTSLHLIPAFDFSDRLEVINPMNLDMNQRMPISPCNGGRKISLKRQWEAFLPLAIDIIKCSAAQNSSSGADGFQSDGGNDDEYLPSTPTDVAPQKPLPSSSTQEASTSTSSSRPSKRPRTDGRTHGSAPSRNRQATADQVEDIQVKLSLCRVSNRDRLRDLGCPVVGCQYKQLNGRMPDFRRHVRTHMRDDGKIRCKGVPLEDFERRRYLFPKIPSDQQPYAVPDEDGLWIGGCLKTFSRADALKRHLRNTSCAGLHHNRRRIFPAVSESSS